MSSIAAKSTAKSTSKATYSAVPPRKTTLDMPPLDIAGRMIGIVS
jgi:hypothetical protein